MHAQVHLLNGFSQKLYTSVKVQSFIVLLVLSLKPYYYNSPPTIDFIAITTDSLYRVYILFKNHSNSSTFIYFLILASLIPLGMDISPIDLINIQSFASRVIGLVKYRQELSQYLSTKMTLVAPNLTTLIGEQVSIMTLTT